MEKKIISDTAGSHHYCGRILYGNYSPELKMHVSKYISNYQTFDEDGTLGIAYISAWRAGEEAIWYEYVSRRFLALLNCTAAELSEVFKHRIVSRHIYKYSSEISDVSQEILTKQELIRIQEDLREEAKNTETIQAIYQLSTGDGHTVWLKDQARIVFYQQDNICLSYGVLVDVSNEMIVEQKLKETQEDLKRTKLELESRVQKRTAKLARLNEKLKHEIEDRRRAERDRQKALSDLKKAVRGTIQAIAITVESKDAYTAGHQQRVANLATAIGKEMQLSAEILDGIQMAGYIHDLGKVAIPGEILSKPISLNDAEFTIIRTHPEVGYEILKDIDFPWDVAEIVYQHHEKINGSGYPRGLMGDNILMEAKVITVADSVVAMASHRPYRAALGIDRALEEISENQGVLYDSDVSQACLDLFMKKGVRFGH